MKYLALALVLCTATVVGATTWHVAQDGSGDFEIIQDAVDAAEPGDVIHIHAGRYLNVTEHWDVWGDGTSYADNHVVITKDNLTLQGDGPDMTIIGPVSLPSNPDPNYTGISVTFNEATTLTVRDLAVENVNYGVFGACSYLTVSNCRFEGHGRAIYLSDADGLTVVSECYFKDLGGGVSGIHDSDNIELYNCVFNDCSEAASFIGNNGVVVNGCEFAGGIVGVDLQQGSSGTVSNCTFRDVYVTAIGAVFSSSVEVRGCTIDGGIRGVYVEGSGGSYVEECTFTGQSFAASYFNSGDPNTLTDCNIYNGGEWSVYCRASGDCYLDMRGNYWGTDDEAQIQAWIYDANDDPAHNCTVDYIPFSSVVSIEQKSWSEVKGLFRE